MDHQVDRFGLSPKWLWQFARARVIIGAGVCVAEPCPPCFEPRAQAFFGICKLDSVKSCGLTMRAADGGYAPRFLAFSWLWVFPVSRASPPSHPPQLTHTVRRHGFFLE